MFYLKNGMNTGRQHQPPVEEHFQKIAAQMADIEASKPRARLVHHADLPQRERGAPRVAEQFWRQAATRKDRAPSKRRPHTLPRSKRKSLPLALKRWGPRCTGRAGGAAQTAEHAHEHCCTCCQSMTECSIEQGQQAARLWAENPAVSAQQARCQEPCSSA